VGIRQHAPDSREFAKRLIGFGQLTSQAKIEVQFRGIRRQFVGFKASMPCRRTNQLSGRELGEILAAQWTALEGVMSAIKKNFDCREDD
jgi:hypothetical protein